MDSWIYDYGPMGSPTVWPDFFVAAGSLCFGGLLFVLTKFLHRIGGFGAKAAARRRHKRGEQFRARESELLGVLAADNFSTVAHDGVELKCSIKRSKNPSAKLMFLFAPLGSANMLSFWPIIEHFGDEYHYLSWQYRGMFENPIPEKARDASIADHARDGRDVLKQAGVDKADIVLSHR